MLVQVVHVELLECLLLADFLFEGFDVLDSGFVCSAEVIVACYEGVDFRLVFVI